MKEKIMKTIIVNIFLLIVIACSCKKQDESKKQEHVRLPIRKVSIFEYDNERLKQDSTQFRTTIYGFCELDKELNLKVVLRSYNGDEFYEPEVSIPDSMKNKICEILQFDWQSVKFDIFGISKDFNFPVKSLDQKDFYYLEDAPDPQDYHSYILLIEKDDGQQTVIKFAHLSNLPFDLRLLFYYLYGKNRNINNKSHYDNVFNNLDSYLYFFETPILPVEEYMIRMIENGDTNVVEAVRFKLNENNMQ